MGKRKKRKTLVRQAVQRKIDDSPSIPRELRERNQWTCWDEEESQKVPYNPTTGRRASCKDPSDWVSYDEASAAVERNEYDGINFALSEDDPYVGLDLDHCIEDDQIAPWAKKTVEALNSYTTISPSGTGLRIFIKGKIPGVRRKKGHVEMYDASKFLSVTENHLPGTPKEIYERQEALNRLYHEIFGDDKPKRTAVKIDEPVRLEDHRVIKQAVKGSATFRKLYKTGNYEGEYDSRSEADMALIAALSHYTKNREQAKRIFRQSMLCKQRDWSKKRWKPYLDTIIDKVFVEDPGNPWTAISQDEIGDARLLIYLFNYRYCYDHAAAKWYEFQEHYWTQDYVRNPGTMPDRFIAEYEEECAKLAPSAESESNAELYLNMVKACKKRIAQLQKRHR